MKAADMEHFTRIVGLDGGVKTGLAVWLPEEQRFERVDTVDFWEAFFTIAGMDEATTAVVIEDPAQNRPVFARKGVTGRKALRVAQNVGGVKRESELLATGLERMGFPVARVRPGTEKWSAERFRRVTRHGGRTTEHARDAAKLVFGMGPSPFMFRVREE